MFEHYARGPTTRMSCLRTSVTVLYQDMGDGSGGLGGDTSGPMVGRWLSMNPSNPVSAWRSRSGPRTRLGARSRRSVSSTGSPARRSMSCASAHGPCDRGLRQGGDCSRRAATTAVGQRARAEPDAAGHRRPAHGTRRRAGHRGDHGQAGQADHPRQERTLPPNPVPLPRQAAPGRVAGRTPGAGRQVRPHLQHPAPPPRIARADHAGGRVGGDPQSRSAPPETGPAHIRDARPQNPEVSPKS